MLLRLPQEGYPFPRARPARHRARSRHQARRLYAAAQSRARGRASPASPPRASARLRRRACRRARPLPARRALRPPQGRRPQGGDGLDAAVQHGLGRAGADRRDRRGRHPICEHPGPPAGRPGPLARRQRRLFSTGEGFRLEGAWEHRNLFPPEGALRVAAIAGTKEQNLSVRFRRNNWGQRDRALLLQLDIGRRDFEAFQGYTARLYGLVSRESTPIWQKRWTYAYGAELLATNENRNGTAVISLSDAYFIGGLIGQLGYDRSNSLLDPTRGFRLLARVNPEASLRDGTSFYVRNLIEGSALLSGRRAVRHCRPRPHRLDLRHRPRRSRAVAPALCGRRRLGARLRLPGAGPARHEQHPARRAQPRRIRARGPLPLRQLRRGGLRRCRPGL